ncbi:MAG: nicotinate (nicotinamide) nucleotide adenylyltransferase [Clostridiales bacterium]|nr:nicotinate (nicotinamide) nucleotide adenylyltransferase [Clostridiales bacterium]
MSKRVKIGVYGGTFNPPHLGHMAAARDVSTALGLDRLLLIPDRTPPHKELPDGSASPDQRLEMTRIAADRLSGGATKFAVSDVELGRTGRSYTADTLTQLREQYPEDELWLLMGTDMFLTLHTWYRPDVICQKAHIAAFGRAAGDEARFAEQKARLERDYGATVEIIPLPGLVEVSSTQLRRELAQGGGQELLDESVYGYILRQGLYGVEKDLTLLSLDDLRAASYSMVKAKRLPHIRGTEEEAALLARRWGADETAARKAAILHDCTKYWNLEEQLQYCEKCGILLDQVERETLSLLHAKSGAEVARRVFGMPEEICSSICWHTTGKADMTLLEKILYIADYAEPSRSYDWCRELRELVLEDLDAAVLYGLNVTVSHTRKKGQTIHYRTLEAREYLLAQR